MSQVTVGLAPMADRLGDEEVGLLSPAEVATASRFVDPRRGAWYGGSRAWLRRVVGWALQVDPVGIRLGRQPCPRCGDAQHGPPVITEPSTSLRFSLSRSNQLVALALGWDAAVGVDVEQLRPLDDLPGLMASALSETEQAQVGSGAGSADRFLRCWARKEAITKAAGVGIAVDLRVLDVGLLAADHVVVDGPRELPPVRWRVDDLDAGHDVFAAVARPESPPSVLAVHVLAAAVPFLDP
jgi:4'-phosphopantetheinyl transferase